MWKYSRCVKNLITNCNLSVKTNYLHGACNFDISEEVRYGLKTGAPIVALESTIITHGMPYPENMKCALDVENIIREQSAIPATIAILGGKITVGLNHEQISFLADTKQNKAIKTSRRDYPYVISKQLHGGTTVSGTIIVAEKVGIPIFVTGGIGGVHREGENTLDISADLTELGRSSVAVISAGIKSILDIPRTLEYLETQGVFVASFGPTTNFPAFYSRTSGVHSQYNVINVQEAAKIIKSSIDLELKSGMLFAVPVPEADALSEDLIQEAIEEALNQAREKGITGKNITPFLLSAIAHITEGKSLQTNVALIKNNAKIGAQISFELSQLKSSTKPRNKAVNEEKLQNNSMPVVVGGSNLDYCASIQDVEIKMDGRLHRTKFGTTAGGVGRNICEALEKLGAKPSFISVVGNDNHGVYLRSLLQPSSTKSVEVISGTSTAQCTVVLDSNGECKMLLGNMDIHKKITPEMIKAQQELLKRSPLIVTDGNLPVETLSSVLEIADKYGKPVFHEPTDVHVADRPFLSAFSKSIKFISPNLNELRCIIQTLGYQLPESSLNPIAEARELGLIISKYIDTTFITLGALGIVVVRRGNATDPLLPLNSSKINKVQFRHYYAQENKNIVNVSGAGDCLASGIICAMLNGCSENVCISVGLAAAKMALLSQSPVPSLLFDKSHESWSIQAPYEQLQNF